MGKILDAHQGMGGGWSYELAPGEQEKRELDILRGSLVAAYAHDQHGRLDMLPNYRASVGKLIVTRAMDIAGPPPTIILGEQADVPLIARDTALTVARSQLGDEQQRRQQLASTEYTRAVRRGRPVLRRLLPVSPAGNPQIQFEQHTKRMGDTYRVPGSSAEELLQLQLELELDARYGAESHLSANQLGETAGWVIDRQVSYEQAVTAQAITPLLPLPEIS
jgi:hypothetical protein